ncbi:hypothetical protein BaRGS_00021045 [Batillaria attramentaria]|uniref:Uncharacterized protein n=1 Tax=Batillaria attramentaria TaxID=370345 RepID=A0ABD0KKN3_9CAEN
MSRPRGEHGTSEKRLVLMGWRGKGRGYRERERERERGDDFQTAQIHWKPRQLSASTQSMKVLFIQNCVCSKPPRSVTETHLSWGKKFFPPTETPRMGIQKIHDFKYDNMWCHSPN